MPKSTDGFLVVRTVLWVAVDCLPQLLYDELLLRLLLVIQMRQFSDLLESNEGGLLRRASLRLRILSCASTIHGRLKWYSDR